MIDVSDGLALDLHRLADASGVGFALDAIPVAEGATLEEALGGGEDYELIVAVDPRDVEAYAARAPPPGCGNRSRSGYCSPTERRGGGRDEKLERLGWQHAVG